MSSSRRQSRPLMLGTAAAAALALGLAPMAHAAGAALRLGTEGLTGEAPANRYETAVGVSKLGFEDGSAEAVVLARSDVYADALAGGALAAAKGAPLLLTKVGNLPSATLAELERVLAEDGTVYVLGGTAAVSEEVFSQVGELAAEVVRIQGDNRYETALAIAEEIGSEGPVLLSTGTEFPDALAAGAAAGSEGGVVLLTRGERLPGAVAAHLEAFEGDVYAVGGPAVEAAADLEGVTLISGEDRYATAVEVAETFFDDHQGFNGFVLASSEEFPDALAGGASSGSNNDPVLLTKKDTLPNDTADYLTAASDGKFLFGFVLGGPSAISDEVIDSVNSALNPTE